MDDYHRTLEWLYSLEKSKGIELKLERVQEALERLDNPQRALRCFHVAGTNGKGSVVAFLAAMLASAGHRVGVYTSPHLVELAERIRVGSVDIERSEIVALAEEVRSRVLDRGIGLTFFEVVTAMAFLHFARAEVDYAILEVGLGGRLDATNVVDPLVAVITSIGIDHVGFLGSSLREIAFEKAGIVKPGRPLVVGSLGEPAAEVVTEIALERGAPIYRPGREYDWQLEPDGRMSFAGMGWKLDALEVGLAGRFQRRNAATAVATLAAVRGEVQCDERAVRDGLRGVRWPGRLETVLEDPTTILDGAHNVDAIRTLVAELEAVLGARPLRVLFAAMGDKDWRQMIDVLAPHCAAAVVTEVIPDRAVHGAELYDAFSRHCPTAIEADPVAAFERVLSEATVDEVVLVTGSLFLVGVIHEYLQVGRRGGACP